MDSNNILKIISEFLENEFPEHTLYLSDLTDYNSWKFRMEGDKNYIVVISKTFISNHNQKEISSWLSKSKIINSMKKHPFHLVVVNKDGIVSEIEKLD